MPEATDRYTATRLSAELGLDNRKIRDILTRVNPVQVKGRSKLYLLRDVIPHAAKYLGAPDVIDLNAERARKVKAEAELAEIELAKEREDLIQVEAARPVWGELVIAAKSRLLSILAKLAPVVAVEDASATCKYLVEEQIGVGGEGRALVGRPSKNNVGKVRLFPVGVDTAKELIYARLKIKEPGPGYCHFLAHYDDEYFRQLTAEQIVTRFSKGFRKREWKKIRARNEALDCRVYALAAYALLNANINQIANRIDRKIETVEPKPEPASPARRIRRPKQQNWVNGWR